MVDVFIVIKEYDDQLAKRQPWYSIKKIITDLKMRGLKVVVVSDVHDIPMEFNKTVIKTFSLSDLWKKKVGDYKLVYLMTFPAYSFKKFLYFSKRVLFENWKDLKRCSLYEN